MPDLVSENGANILHDTYSELGNPVMFVDGTKRIAKAISIMTSSLRPVVVDGQTYYNSEELLIWYRVAGDFSYVNANRMVDLSPETVEDFKNHISLYKSLAVDDKRREHLKRVCGVLLGKIWTYLEFNGKKQVFE